MILTGLNWLSLP